MTKVLTFCGSYKAAPICIVICVCLHLLVLLWTPNSNLAWKVEAFAQLSYDKYVGNSRHNLWRKPYKPKDEVAIAVGTNRQFEVVSPDSPLHPVYVKCCPESPEDEDIVCTCSHDQEESKTFTANTAVSSSGFTFTPVERIVQLAGEVLQEMAQIEEGRVEDIFNNSYTQFKWFLDHEDNLTFISNAIFSPSGQRPVTENESNFQIFEKKFQVWCEDQESKGFVERRFNLTNNVREGIYERVHCEADEYDLEKGCLRKDSKRRANNNAILEVEQMEKVKARGKCRYDSLINSRAERTVALIEQAIKRAGGEGDRSIIEDEDEDDVENISSTNSTELSDKTRLEDLFQSLDEVKVAKEEDLRQLISACLSDRRLEFIEKFVGEMANEQRNDRKRRQEIEAAKQKMAEAKRKADEAKLEAKKQQANRKRAARAKSDSKSKARSSVRPTVPVQNATLPDSSTHHSNSTSQQHPTAAVPVQNTAAEGGQNHSKRSRGRGGRSRTKSRMPAPPPPPPATPTNSSQNVDSKLFVREKRLKQKQLKADEDTCHTIYQASLKTILSSAAIYKNKIHKELISAETDKQNCLRRARKRYTYAVEHIGLE